MALLHPEEVKCRLRIKFGTLRNFERANDLPLDSARDALRCRTSGKTLDAIREALGFKKLTIMSRPKRNKRILDENSSAKSACHRLNEGVN